MTEKLDQQEVLVDCKCPDCGHKNMVEREGTRFDIFTGRDRKTLQCPQCRRWIYDERDADSNE